MNIIDIIVLLLLAGGAWKGFRRGLLQTAAGLLGVVVGLVVSAVCYRPVSFLVQERLGLVGKISVYLGQNTPLAAPVTGNSGDYFTLQGFLQALQDLSVPDIFKGELTYYLHEAVAAPSPLPLGRFLYDQIAVSLLNGIIFILMCVIIAKLVYLACSILSGAVSLTPLSPFNRLGGMLAGLFLRGMSLTIGLVVLTPLLSLMVAGDNKLWAGISDAVGHSLICPYLMETGLFLSRELINLL